MNWFKKLFHRHEWYYCLGDSPGVISGKPRLECFRRVCPGCGRVQEVVNYGDTITLEGTVYFGRPNWLEVE